MSLPVLMSSPPHAVAPDPARTVNLTMWETSRISPAAVARCDALRALIVPAAPVAGWFRESGVAAPIRVVPLGLDPAVFHPRGRPDPAPGDPVVLGCAGRTAHGGVRKSLDDVVAAFLDAFPDDPGVRLEVKCWPDCQVFDPGDPRVLIRREPLPAAGLAAWYRSLDAFVSASRGEGWGLQPHQAMATGTPVIAPLWGGHLGYMTPEACYPVEFDERPAAGPVYGGLGDWCVPKHGSLVETMRRVVADKNERIKKGQIAASRAAEFTWHRTAEGVLEVLREFEL